MCPVPAGSCWPESARDVASNERHKRGRVHAPHLGVAPRVDGCRDMDHARALVTGTLRVAEDLTCSRQLRQLHERADTACPPATQ